MELIPLNIMDPSSNRRSTAQKAKTKAIHSKQETGEGGHSADYVQLRRDDNLRALHGHPWVYRSDASVLPAAEYDGQAVPLKDARGRFLGMGLFNSRSQIVWRAYSREAVPLDKAQITRALKQALARRPKAQCQRLVWSEADGLPGLVVDRFEDVLVVQALTLGMDQRLPVVQEVLQEELAPAEIIYRNDAPSRAHEGMEAKVYTASGRDFPVRWFTIEGIEFQLDLQHGQKTGFYLDQITQHRRVGALANGRRVLDGFCHLGGFALHCAKAGAKEVIAVDSSAEAIASVWANADRNRLQVEAVEANMFDWLRAHEQERFDLIILDPPSFARNKRSLAGALRGYKELNLRALKMLNPGGILATYSCSQAVDAATFTACVAEAAADARRVCRIREQTGQPADHPVLLSMPESAYLKGLILEVD